MKDPDYGMVLTEDGMQPYIPGEMKILYRQPPEEGKRYTRDFSDMAEALRRSVDAAYDLERKDRTKDVPYDGPEIEASAVLSTSFTVAEALTAEQLNYDEDNQGRDAMHVILGKAIQLGMEQAYRMMMDEAQDKQHYRLEIIQEYFQRRSDGEPLKEFEHERALWELNCLAEYASDPGHLLPVVWGPMTDEDREPIFTDEDRKNLRATMREMARKNKK